MQKDKLLREGAPHWVVRFGAGTRNPDAEYAAAGQVVRKFRGSKCRNVKDLMSEFGAALQFFDGFGENWHALKECLSYMDEWLPGSGYVLVFEHAELFLIDEPEQLQWFVTTLDEVACWWTSSVENNGRFDRAPKPFHIIIEMADGVVPPLIEAVRTRGTQLPVWSGS